ncbi:MAG: alpha/beta hydrolase-fold protein [Candidatus Solibacter sp.]
MSRFLPMLLTVIAVPVWSQAPAVPQPAAPGAAAAPGAGRGNRPSAPTRDPHTPGYVQAKELPDGEIPAVTADGNFIIGPTHNPAPQTVVKDGVPKGEIVNFTMESADSKYYPGVARDTAPPPPEAAQPAVPADPAARRRNISNHPAPYTRKVAVYVPKQYVPGTEAPFIVGADGPDNMLFTVLDNMIAEKKLPVMIAISIGNGSGDGPGSQRGLEYDTMSGKYAEFVENEVLPLVEKNAKVKLTKDPDARATMGGSSGGSAALAMAWFHPELYHRVLTYSGTFVNQQWPTDPALPHGGFELHESLIPNSPVKPIRLWMEVGDRDNGGNNNDELHDWVIANEKMAAALAAKGYHYQFVFAVNAGHTDRTVKQQTLPLALEYTWLGYKKK